MLPQNRVISLRSSQQTGKVRLVVETEDAPDYQVYQQGEHVYIELFDTTSAVSPERLPRHSTYIKDQKTQCPALGLFRWDVTCCYPVPPEQIRVTTLNNPPRVVVDLYTNWIDEENFQLTPGVTWKRRQYYGQTFPYLLWNQVLFDPRDPHITLDIGLAKDSACATEKVSSIVSRRQALVGINGGYFATSGGALGLVVRNGKIVTPNVSRRPPRSAFALTKDKKPVFARAKVADNLLLTTEGKLWPDIDLALGGGPRLVQNGTIKLTTDLEELGPRGNDITRSCGRTAVSADRYGRVALSTASDYSDSHSRGAKLEQMAQLLIDSGAVDAVNLDGGGSVDMAIQGKLAAHGPREGTYERPVANTLLLFDDRPTLHPSTIDVQANQTALTADGQSTFAVTALITDAQGNPVADDTPVTFSAPGLATTKVLTTQGQAHTIISALRRPGPFTVTVRSGVATAELELNLNAASPSRLLAEWQNRIVTSPALYPDRPSDAWGPIRQEPQPAATSLPEASPSPDLEGNDPAAAPDTSATETQPSLEQEDSQGTQDQETSNAHDSVTSDAPLRQRIINLHLRVIDKWYNGVAGQDIEVWNGDKLLNTYSADGNGEVQATLQIPADIKAVTVKVAGLEPTEIVF